MKSYDEIKSELIEIADILKKYPENIQPQVFDILTKHFIGYNSGSSSQSEQNPSVEEGSRSEKVNKEKSKPNGKPGGRAKDNLSLIKELNLRPSGKKSFKDFYEEKNPTSAFEFNTVAVYYLIEELQLSGITQNHIYTCYKEVAKRPPEAFNQSMRDTASKNGYIDTSDINNIKIPLRGKNFVEHDLPKQKASK